MEQESSQTEALTCPHCNAILGEDERGFICPGCIYRTYWYVNRWYDEAGTAHYFGIQTKWPTLKAAQENVRFNVIATPVDLIYGPCTLAELCEYTNDVSADNPDDPEGLGATGTVSWPD